eukprot:TCONS_00057185-protein
MFQTSKQFITVFFFIHCFATAFSQNSGPFDQCYGDKELINGCSVPWGFNFPYKGLFTLACDYHDVCYSCAAGLESTRTDCDKTFLQNMQYLCYKTYPITDKPISSRISRNKRSFTAWQKFIEALKGSAAIGLDFWKWFGETWWTLDHCLTGAHVYFNAVKHFSMDYFHEEPETKCQMPCAQIMGNPRLTLNSTDSKF